MKTMFFILVYLLKQIFTLNTFFPKLRLAIRKLLNFANAFTFAKQRLNNSLHFFSNKFLNYLIRTE
jgi:hypothetical protein